MTERYAEISDLAERIQGIWDDLADACADRLSTRDPLDDRNLVATAAAFLAMAAQVAAELELDEKEFAALARAAFGPHQDTPNEDDGTHTTSAPGGTMPS